MTSTQKSISNRKPKRDYMADCKAGHAMARTVVERLQAGASPMVLAPLVREMLADGEFGGYANGFFSRIAQHLARP